MKKRGLRFPFIRNHEAAYLVELFSVSAVFAIVGIRVFLSLSGYPQLGGEGLHIAHMLWGGLLMLIALILFFFSLNRAARPWAAIIAGLGFGTFIDELGKFITADNDYFFQPTFALIYLIFICLFFAFRWILHHQPLSPTEYLANALDLLQDATVGDFDLKKRKQFQQYLKQANLSASISKQLNLIVTQIKTAPTAKPDLYARLKFWLQKQILSWTRSLYFQKGLTLFFIIRAFLSIGVALYLVFFLGLGFNEFFNPELINQIDTALPTLGFFEWGAIVSSIITSTLAFIGIIQWRHSFSSALIWFKRSVLFSILVAQFFAFYQRQLLALIGLSVELLLLYSLNLMTTLKVRSLKAN